MVDCGHAVRGPTSLNDRIDVSNLFNQPPHNRLKLPTNGGWRYATRGAFK